MRLKSLCLVVGLLMLFSIVGNTGFAEDKVLKVGVVGPFTGPSADTGQQFRSSVTLALEKQNYMVGDYKLEPVWVDSQSDPAKASNAYSEAIERGGIQVGLLNWHSSVAVALMDLTAQYKIPHFMGCGASEVVIEKFKSDPAKFNYWGCKGWPVPGNLMKGYVETLNDAIKNGAFKPENKLVGIYGEDTDWGRSAGAALKSEFEATGWKVDSEDYFSITQTDFYPLLSKYKKAGVSVIAGTSTSLPGMTAFIKQSKEVGLKAIIVADGLGWGADWYKMTGVASDYVLDMIPQLGTPASKAWAKEFEEKFKIKPSVSAAGLAYDYTNFFLKILNYTLKKHGNLDKESIHDVAINDIATGKLTFSEKDGAILMKEYRYTPETYPDPVVSSDGFFFPVIQYKNGKGDIVYPPAMAERSFEPKK